VRGRAVGPGVDPEDEAQEEIDQARADEDGPGAAAGSGASPGPRVGVGVRVGALYSGVEVGAVVRVVVERIV
jgi:hypothetical protein